jgi:hypothetical protein
MIEWLPAVSVVDVHIAVAVLPLVPAATAAQPEIAAPPSVNATVPVGAVPLTVATKVTLAPTAAGLAELNNAVVVTPEPPPPPPPPGVPSA